MWGDLHLINRKIAEVGTLPFLMIGKSFATCLAEFFIPLLRSIRFKTLTRQTRELVLSFFVLIEDL